MRKGIYWISQVKKKTSEQVKNSFTRHLKYARILLCLTLKWTSKQVTCNKEEICSNVKWMS